MLNEFQTQTVKLLEENILQEFEELKKAREKISEDKSVLQTEVKYQLHKIRSISSIIYELLYDHRDTTWRKVNLNNIEDNFKFGYGKYADFYLEVMKRLEDNISFVSVSMNEKENLNFSRKGFNQIGSYKDMTNAFSILNKLYDSLLRDYNENDIYSIEGDRFIVYTSNIERLKMNYSISQIGIKSSYHNEEQDRYKVILNKSIITD